MCVQAFIERPPCVCASMQQQQPECHHTAETRGDEMEVESRFMLRLIFSSRLVFATQKWTCVDV